MKIPGYKLHRQIGKGGMATVFLATQLSFERKVALKLIADSAFGTSELAERFQREAKIVARLSHPHIVPVYDVGRVEKVHFLAMDYLPGGDLNSFIRSGLEADESIKILSQLAQALHFAHSKGYIHLDVKPDNILFREDNSAVLTDFGIARPMNTGEQISGKKLVFGTPAYMSPEQSQGKETDGRTDLYSLGIIFYKMLTRQQPFNADDPVALALKHISEPVPQLPPQLSGYQGIINQLLAKNPDDRFQSGLALSKALAALNPSEISASKLQASPMMSRENISLQVLEQPDKSLAKKNIIIKESSYRRLGLAKRYIFECQLSSDDLQQFSLLFGQFTSRVLEWHSQHAKQCEKVILNLCITEAMLPRASQLIEGLTGPDQTGAFDFLDKIQFEIDIRDFQNKALDFTRA